MKNPNAKSNLKIMGVILLIALLAITDGAQFLHDHDLQSPIIPHFELSVKIQLPWKDKLLSPMASQSAFIPQAQAAGKEEPEIDPGKVDVFNQDEVRLYIRQEAIKKWGTEEWNSLDKLLTGESNYQTYVWNHQGSGACGIFQFLPCEKYGIQGLDLKNQTIKGFAYIENKYVTPSNAYKFWLSQAPVDGKRVGNWY